jgi:hypothetical protein
MNTTFRKLDLFPFSGEKAGDTYSVGSHATHRSFCEVCGYGPHWCLLLSPKVRLAHPTDWWSVKALDLDSGDARFESQTEHKYSDSFTWFSSDPSGKYRDSASIGPLSVRSKYLLIQF